MTLDIYDNEKLLGNPVYIIDNKNVTDLKGEKKIFDYRDYYKMASRIDEINPTFLVTKPFPYDFVKVSWFGYVLPIESKNGDILKISEKELYFKVKFEKLGTKLTDIMEWRRDTSLEGASKLIKEEKELGNFMRDFSNCVKKEDVGCLFSLNPGFREGIEVWNNIFSADHCKNDPEVKKISEKKEKIVVNWELYKNLLDLKDKEIRSVYVVSNFGKEKRFELILDGKEVCKATSQIYILYTRDLKEAPRIQVITTPAEG